MMGDLTDEIAMEKALKLSKSTGTKHKVFDFTLDGTLDECVACANILNAVDLDEHGLQFLYLKEDKVSYVNRGIKFKGLIGVKKATTIEGMISFFRALDIPLWDCISLVSLCEDVNSWLEKKTYLRLEKGTHRVPAHEDLANW